MMHLLEEFVRGLIGHSVAELSGEVAAVVVTVVASIMAARDELTFEHEREAYETFEAERAVEDGHEWPYG